MEYRYTDDKTGRHIVVEGEMIGQASTEHASAIRWTEIQILKATSGKYVVVSIGRSLVFHRADGGCGPENQPFGRLTAYNDLTDEHEDCPVCKPEDDEELPKTVRLEENRTSVSICETPDEVYKALETHDRDRLRFISKVASKALEQARTKDPNLVQTVLV